MRKQFLVTRNPHLPIFRAVVATIENFENLLPGHWYGVPRFENFECMRKRVFVTEKSHIPIVSTIVATVKMFQILKFTPPPTRRNRLSGLSLLGVKLKMLMSRLVDVLEYVKAREIVRHSTIFCL